MAINGTPIEQWCAGAFGFPDAALLGLAQTTKWESSPKSPLAVFDRNEFDDCLQGFGRPS